jgi:hypothetical protein
MELIANGLSPAQAARRLDVTPSRVRQLMATGHLAYIATPLGRLIDAASVETLRIERARRSQERAPVSA